MNLRMVDICKSFGTNEVLKKVNFSVNGGEIIALLGENGAGKSTMMNILGGVLAPNSGEILLDGKKVSFSSTVESLDAGIGFIHQELNLINDLTIYENMFLTHFEKNKMFLNAKTMRQKTQELFDQMGIKLDPNTMVRDLDASYKQIVEICKALLQKASIIIMDEPTTSLTEAEIARVFDMMRMLKKQGVGLIFISHKLNEVMEICDTYAVLRDGNLVDSGNVADTTIKKISESMVGHEVNTENLERDINLGNEVLKVEKLSDNKHYFDIDLTLRKGEVLGVTGLLGDGRSELFQTIFGARGGNYTGKIYVSGKEEHVTTTYQAQELGLAYVPSNRKENGILKDLSILHNGSLAHLPKIKKGLLIDEPQEKELFQKQVVGMSIKMKSEDDLITSLSGGNQQKVVLAKWLMTNPKVLILDNPTQGVDVGAKEEIYEIIHGLAEEGVAIVIISSEAQEIVRVCDRSLVLFHGKIAGEVHGDDMNEHQIMYLATGGNENQGRES